MRKLTFALATAAVVAASAGNAFAHNQYKDEAPFPPAAPALTTTAAPALQAVQSPTPRAGLLHDEGGYVGVVSQPQARGAARPQTEQSPVAKAGLYHDEGMYVGPAVGG